METRCVCNGLRDREQPTLLTTTCGVFSRVFSFFTARSCLALTATAKRLLHLVIMFLTASATKILPPLIVFLWWFRLERPVRAGYPPRLQSDC